MFKMACTKLPLNKFGVDITYFYLKNPAEGYTVDIGNERADSSYQQSSFAVKWDTIDFCRQRGCSFRGYTWSGLE